MKLDGDEVPVDHIIQAAAAVGLDGDGVDKMAARIERRRKLKAIAVTRPAIEKELEAVDGEIRKVTLVFESARDKYNTDVMPLYEKRNAIQARFDTAHAANTSIMDPDLLEPAIVEKLRAAREAHGKFKTQMMTQQNELHGLRGHLETVEQQLKSSGIKAAAWRDKDIKEFRAKNPSDMDADAKFRSAQSFLAAMDEMPAKEKAYAETVAAYEQARDELDAAEKEALAS
jgi:hypothetical protein